MVFKSNHDEHILNEKDISNHLLLQAFCLFGSEAAYEAIQFSYFRLIKTLLLSRSIKQSQTKKMPVTDI